MGNLVLQNKNKPSWVRYIQKRVEDNKNFLGFISGSTGSGKSYSSLAICEMVDESFNIERIVFSGKELMDLINSGTLKKGSAICFEEAGIGMSSRNWQSITNKMINFLMQTFRHRNFVLILNSPYMDFVDASTRRLFHAEFKTISINYEKQMVKLQPQTIQYNSRMAKFYYKHLRVITPEGVIPIRRWNVPKPSEELRKLYEVKKRKFTDGLNEDINNELNKLQPSIRLTIVQDETIKLLKEGLIVPEIAKKRNKTERTIYDTMRRIENRGIPIKPIYEGDRVVKYEVGG